MLLPCFFHEVVNGVGVVLGLLLLAVLDLLDFLLHLGHLHDGGDLGSLVGDLLEHPVDHVGNELGVVVGDARDLLVHDLVDYGLGNRGTM